MVTYDLRFPGQIAGAWGSTYQNYMRDYDSAVGRYVESDPMGLAGGGFSTYAYVGEDPLSRTDPNGRQEEEEVPSFIHPIVPPPESLLEQLEEYEYQRALWETQGQNTIEQMLASLGNQSVHLVQDGAACYKDEPTTLPPPQCIGTLEQCSPESVLP